MPNITNKIDYLSMVAIDYIKEGENLGPAFVVRKRTGSFKQDIVPTKLGKNLKVDKRHGNATLKHIMYKIYLVAIKDIQPGQVVKSNIYVTELETVRNKYGL